MQLLQHLVRGAAADGLRPLLEKKHAVVGHFSEVFKKYGH
jgi:hypothetical protein